MLQLDATILQVLGASVGGMCTVEIRCARLDRADVDGSLALNYKSRPVQHVAQITLSDDSVILSLLRHVTSLSLAAEQLDHALGAQVAAVGTSRSY